MPQETGLPEYVSRYKDGILRYYRRPPKGVVGTAFVRAFGTKDRKVMLTKYGPVHAEAETYFERLISGRTLTDDQLDAMGSEMIIPLMNEVSGQINSASDLETFIAQHGTPEMKALTGSDRTYLLGSLEFFYKHTERVNLTKLRIPAEAKAKYVAARFGPEQVPAPSGAFTLRNAFDQAWKPAADRSKGTVDETERFVDAFIALNGELDLKDYTRNHWAAWHGECLELHGPGGTAFKRFSMVKTVVSEAIRSGLFERKHHAGQDVTMRKPPRKKLRNEGWSDDELKDLFESDAFTHPDDADAYWIPTIIALTGADLSEVAEMNVADVGLRHGVQTFYLARLGGKTTYRRRIIPIPTKLYDLGLERYIETRDPKGRLFDVTASVYTKRFRRYRDSIGVDRKGCDLKAFRHHMKTMMRNVGAPKDVADYLTGHSGGDVASTYGKTELRTALEYLNRVDLGVVIPVWKQN